MIFWFTILTGVVFAFIGIKKNFFWMWPVLFNILMAVYLSVMLTPTIVELMKDTSDQQYNNTISLVVIAIMVFAVLQIIVSRFFTNTEELSCPKLFSNIGAGILGFSVGYVLCSFIIYIICSTGVLESFCRNNGAALTSAKTIKKVCCFVNGFSLQGHDNVICETVTKFVKPNESPNDVNDIADVNDY